MHGLHRREKPHLLNVGTENMKRKALCSVKQAQFSGAIDKEIWEFFSGHPVEIGLLELIHNPSNYILWVQIDYGPFSWCCSPSVSFSLALAMCSVLPQNKKNLFSTINLNLIFFGFRFFRLFFMMVFFFVFFDVFCRCTIRESLRTNYQLPSGINTLKVPNNLQRYIDLMDWVWKAMWCMNALDGWMMAKRWKGSKTERRTREQSRAYNIFSSTRSDGKYLSPVRQKDT